MSDPLPEEVAPPPWKWRTGEKLGRTIYWGDILHGLIDTRAVAERIVKAMNAEEELRELRRFVFEMAMAGHHEVCMIADDEDGDEDDCDCFVSGAKRLVERFRATQSESEG